MFSDFLSDRQEIIQFLLRRGYSKRAILDIINDFIERGASPFQMGQIFYLINSVCMEQVSSKLETLSVADSLKSGNSDQSVLKKTESKLSFLSDKLKKSTQFIAPYFSVPAMTKFTPLEPENKTFSNEEPNEKNSRSLFPAAPVKSNPNVAIKESPISSDGQAIVDQDHIYSYVFLQVAENVNISLSDYIIEYIKSLNEFNTTPMPFVFELLVKRLLLENRIYQIHQMFEAYIIQDSIHLAIFLLEQDEIKNLGEEMLRRLGAIDELLKFLVDEERIVEAIRLSSEHGKKLTLSRLVGSNNHKVRQFLCTS